MDVWYKCNLLSRIKIKSIGDRFDFKFGSDPVKRLCEIVTSSKI
jgi:hypothetical protein